MSADVLHDDAELEGVKAKNGARSIAERAEDGESGVPEEELFPKGSLDGDGVTAQSYIKRGLPIEFVVALSRQEIPLRGRGLPDPNKYGRAIVTYLPGQKKDLPIREDKNDPAKTTGAKVCVDLRIVHAADANDPAELARTEFEVLLAEDAKKAAELFAELREMMVDALGSDAA